MRRRYLLLPPLFLIGMALLRPASTPGQARAVALRVGSFERRSDPGVPPEALRGGTLAGFEAVAETYRLVRASEERYARSLQLRLLARRLNLAYLWFEQARYDRCLRICSSILELDPAYPPALQLKEAAELCHGDRRPSPENGLAWVRYWRTLTDDGDVPRIPDDELLVIRNGDAWKDFVEEELDDTPVRRKLETMRIDLQFERARLEDIMAFIRDFSGIDLYLDRDCREWIDPEASLSFRMKDALLKEVLRELSSRFRLDYVVTEDKAILVTFHARAAAFRRQN